MGTNPRLNLKHNLRAPPITKVHRVLSANPGENGETLCRIPLVWIRDTNGHLLQIKSAKSGKKIRCVWDKDISYFNCNTCQHVWRNITRT